MHVALFGELLESAVHKSDLRNCLENAVVLDRQVQMKRLGSTGCCGPNWNNRRCAMGLTPPFLLVAGGLGGKRRADLGRFLGIMAASFASISAALSASLGGSFIVLSIGAGSRSGLSSGAAASPALAAPSLQQPQQRRLLGRGLARLNLGSGTDLHGFLSAQPSPRA